MAKIGKVQEVATDLLRPYKNNAKLHGDKQIEAIKQSINEFGFISPCLIDREYNIIAGHGRVKAAQELGLKSVPCVFIEGLTEDQRRAYVLADNRLTELGEWDWSIVTEELANIEIDMSSFGFELNKENEWFNRESRWDDSREEGNDEYNEFLDKFEQPKTTDDCYTPDNIYQVIVEYVEKRYGINRSLFVRPFYPGGDYKKENYNGKIVVDNPPFSIIAEIQQYYNDNGIRYFLFCPGLVGFSQTQTSLSCTITVGATITYENGALVPTNFVTNMEDGIVAFSDPDLLEKIEEADEINRAELRRELPKYDYPNTVLSIARMNYLSKNGQYFEIKKGQCQRIGKLDAQDEKGIFGGGLLISQHKAEEYGEKRKLAEINRQKKEVVWNLSEREENIVRSLSND